jgi:hypothetical protein
MNKLWKTAEMRKNQGFRFAFPPAFSHGCKF